MKITASAISLTVVDVKASSVFLVEHLGFREEMSADGFVALTREDVGMNIVFLRRGIEVLPEAYRNQCAAGVIVAFVVRGLEGEEARLRGEGVEITLPLREDPWGERLFQVTDPNGIVYELVEWANGVGPTQGAA
ncbi:VOC family protein [Sorangium sp. So ce131]|uniref:VOC family protein n=1 Tax=Sorangium sp. So ce131 TaxID=3133282 RepID=UPI003F615F01